jgi:hypothetical protein
MISKKTKGSGASGGNGMQTFNTDYLNECEIYHEYKGGHVATCYHCGEDYYLDPKHNQVECLKLMNTMLEQGCPFCNHKGTLTKEYLEWYLQNRKKFLQLDFEIEKELSISAYHKPCGWKPINKTQLKEAWENTK